MKRGRNQRRRQGTNPNRALDSNGPEVRIRGTANQIYDKYIALARDASSAGDRIKAESYLQHAEHYFRMIRAMQPAQPPQSQVDAEGDQPSVSDSDDDGGSDKRRRPQRRPRNGSANDGDAGGEEAAAKSDDEAKASSDGDDAKDEAAEKKPRRRRAPRKSAKTEDSDAEAAAAE